MKLKLNKKIELKKVFISLLICLLTFSCFSTSMIQKVDASAKNISFVRGEKIKYPSWLGNWETYKCYIDGTLAYCLNSSKKTPQNGNYIADISNNEALLKVLYYGYGGKEDLTNDGITNETHRYLYTHIMASFAYSGDIYGGKNWDDLEKNGIGLKGLYNIIQNKPLPQTEYRFSSDSVTAYYDSTINKQRTNEITFISESNINISLPLPNGVELVNTTKGQTFTNSGNLTGGDKFYLQTSSETTGTYQSGEISSQTLTKYAPLVFSPGGVFQAEGTLAIVNDSRTIHLNVNWTEQVQGVDKTDETGETIKNATFDLMEWSRTSAEYKTIQTLNFDGLNNLYSFGKLKKTDDNEGKFKIVETNVPDGYAESSRYEQEFTSDGDILIKTLHPLIDGNKTTFNIYTNLFDAHAIKYEVLDVPDVVTTVKMPTWSISNGQDDIVWWQLGKTSENKWIGNIRMNESGAYNIHFYYDTASSVNHNFGTTTYTPGKIIAINKKQQGQITIKKLDSENKNPLKDVSFNIIAKADIVSPQGTLLSHAGDIVDTITTDSSGLATSKILNLGIYTISEIKAPSGYLLANNVDISLTADGQKIDLIEKTVEITNTKNQLLIHKIDEDSGEVLSDAEFELRNSKNEVIGKYVTDSEGNITIKGLIPDTYTLKETKVPDGYKENPNTYSFEIDQNGHFVANENMTVDVSGNGSLIITNKIDLTSLIVIKKNDSGKVLQGAEFGLYSDKDCENLIKKLTTDENGKLMFENIKTGEYYLKELKSPDGYKLLKDAIKITLMPINGKFTLLLNDQEINDTNNFIEKDGNKYVGTVTIINEKGKLLPETGSSNTLLLIGLGMFCSISGLYLYDRKKRKAGKV